ncbi:MAG: serine protease, partial [Streptomyces sp.]|nr:serine protease [Streptomyces sp.]
MKRIPRISRRVTSPLCAAVVLLVPALTSASLAKADDGPGPLGVTVVAADNAQSRKVGALFDADRRSSLAGGHFCTASVVYSPHRNLIVTAAHCLNGSKDGDLIFVPGYRGGQAPYGTWTVRKAFLPDGWAKGQHED